MQRQCTLDILEAYYWSSLQRSPSAAAAILRNGSHVSSPLRGWRGTCTSPDFSKRTSHNRAFTNEHSFGEAGLTSFSQILKNLEVPQLKESLKNSRGHLTTFNLPEAADSDKSLPTPAAHQHLSAHTYCTALSWACYTADDQKTERREKLYGQRHVITAPCSTVFLPLPCQAMKLGLVWVLCGVLGLDLTWPSSLPTQHALQSWLLSPFAANFRKSFLKQIHTWQNITGDPLAKISTILPWNIQP